MQSTTADADLARRIDAVTRFLPLFEEPGGIGVWAGGHPDDKGVIHMPWFEYSPEALAFMQTCAGNGWVQAFEWPAWQPEAERYFNAPELLNDAPVDDIQKLLTLHIRKDRFVEGHFATMADSGHIAAILRRLTVIRESVRD